MSATSPFVITISRQLGSGGASIGQRVAARLGIGYLDREILQKAAEKLQVSEDLLAAREEQVTPFWQTFVTVPCTVPEALYLPPALNIPTDYELFAVESRIITEVAQSRSAVVVGRGGVHVLHAHPRHLSLFIHAAHAFRVQRLVERYCLSVRDAEEAIRTSDQARARYHQLVACKEWSDARQYHLCLDTSLLGLDTAAELILACCAARFGVAAGVS